MRVEIGVKRLLEIEAIEPLKSLIALIKNCTCTERTKTINLALWHILERRADVSIVPRSIRPGARKS